MERQLATTIKRDKILKELKFIKWGLYIFGVIITVILSYIAIVPFIPV
jgi:hypothetical protein